MLSPSLLDRGAFSEQSYFDESSTPVHRSGQGKLHFHFLCCVRMTKYPLDSSPMVPLTALINIQVGSLNISGTSAFH